MSRKPRLHIPGSFYHVILRGNNKQEIFRSDKDRIDLGARFAAGLSRYGGRIHAWCWMTNHIHVLLQIADRPVGDLMRWVAGTYAKSFNKKNNRTGHLFERRHRALLVQADSYLLSLTRYIHLNPVTAGIATKPEDYRWSSYRAYIGLQHVPWLATSYVLQQFSESRKIARREFRNFTVDSFEDEIDFERGSTRDDRILGDAKHWRNILSQTEKNVPRQTLVEFIAEYCENGNLSVAEVTGPSRQRHLSPIRAAITDHAIKSGIANLAEIAKAFNRSEPVVLRTMNLWKANSKSK